MGEGRRQGDQEGKHTENWAMSALVEWNGIVEDIERGIWSRRVVWWALKALLLVLLLLLLPLLDAMVDAQRDTRSSSVRCEFRLQRSCLARSMRRR